MEFKMIADAVIDAFNTVSLTMGKPFTFIYIALWLGVIYFLCIAIPRTLQTKSWPSTQGTITNSQLRKSKRRTKNGVVTMYSADIAYQYTLLGQQYSGTKIKWLDHRSSSQNPHQKLLDKYPLDAQVQVFYKPSKPSICVLEPGFSNGNVIVFLFFLISLGSMTAVLSSKL